MNLVPLLAMTVGAFAPPVYPYAVRGTRSRGRTYAQNRLTSAARSAKRRRRKAHSAARACQRRNAR